MMKKHDGAMLLVAQVVGIGVVTLAAFTTFAAPAVPAALLGLGKYAVAGGALGVVLALPAKKKGGRG